MSSTLSQLQIATIRKELLELLNSLREEVSGELKDKQSMRVNSDLNDAHDLGDEAQADLEASINITNMSRHLSEIRECMDAIKRLDNGEYGVCVECGEAIELNRLKANPVASRCLSCQSAEEFSHPEVKYASI